MDMNTAFRTGFDFANTVSDEKLLRRPPPAKDITPTVLEIIRACYINGVHLESGKVVTVDREDALNVVAANRGKIIN